MIKIALEESDCDFQVKGIPDNLNTSDYKLNNEDNRGIFFNNCEYFAVKCIL